jgi:putative ABC transport system substrate-binding protein
MRAKLFPALMLFAVLAAGVAPPAEGKEYRIGILTTRSNPGLADGIGRNLARRGYKVGQNLVIDARSADGKPERMPAIAEGLVQSGVDVIVTLGYPAAAAAKAATATVPIIVAGAGDPVETGLAASLSRPGGNVTGMSDMAAELSVKRLDLLRSAVPGLHKVAMLWNADDLGMTTRYKAAEAAAKNLGIAVQPLGVREPDDFETAFTAMTRHRPDGILMVTDALTILNRKRVFEFAAAQKIPAIYEFDFLARDGGLMSYGPDGKENNERVAEIVDRILKGAKPADLPFEQPTRFRFVINLKTAQALGLALPQSLLARADEIVE